MKSTTNKIHPFCDIFQKVHESSIHKVNLLSLSFLVKLSFPFFLSPYVYIGLLNDLSTRFILSNNILYTEKYHILKTIYSFIWKCILDYWMTNLLSTYYLIIDYMNQKSLQYELKS